MSVGMKLSGCCQNAFSLLGARPWNSVMHCFQMAAGPLSAFRSVNMPYIPMCLSRILVMLERCDSLGLSM